MEVITKRGTTSSFDDAMLYLTELIRRLAAPSTASDSQLKSIIRQVHSALDSSESTVRQRHQQCQKLCESISMQINGLESNSTQLDRQLVELRVRQAALEQSVNEKKQLIRDYENKKSNARSKRDGKEVTVGIKAIAGGILSGITFGIALPFVGNYILFYTFMLIESLNSYHMFTLYFIVASMNEDHEECRRLGREMNRYQESIDEVNRQLVSIRNQISQLTARMTEVQSEQANLERKLRRHREDLRETAELSSWISKARTLVSSLHGQATVMYEMNRQQVFLSSVMGCVEDLMQILDGNGSLVSSLATQSIVYELKNEWQVLQSSIQYESSDGNQQFLM